MRQHVDLSLDALDEIRHAIDDGLDQPDQHRRAGGEAWVRLAAARGEDREGVRLRIAEGDEPVAGEDEGDGRGDGLRRLGLIQHRGGHEVRAVFLIEAARRLDLTLLFAGRYLQLERALYLPLLFPLGIEEIDPDRLLGDPPWILMRLERTRPGIVNGEHDPSPAARA